MAYFDPKAWQVILEAARDRAIPKKHSKAMRRRLGELRRELHRARNQEAAARLAEKKKDAGRAEWTRWRARGFLRWHILASMNPGAWYGMADIANAAGAPRRSVKGKVWQYLEPEGLLRRAINPAFDPSRRGMRDATPRYLWTLTASGIAARAEALGKLAALGWPEYSGQEKAGPSSR